MKKFLLSLIVCLMFIASGAEGQSFGIARAVGLGGFLSNTIQAAVRANNGILIDYLYNAYFYVDPVTKVTTSYVNLPAMIAGLGGTVTTTGKYIWNSSGVLTQTANNSLPEPCFSSGGNLKGLCVEAVPATNFALWSEDPTQSTWTKTGVTAVAAAAFAPTGAMTASTLTEDSSNGLHCIKDTISKGTNALSYTNSVFVAPGVGQTRDLVIQVDDGAGNGAYALFPFESGGSPNYFPLGSSPFTVSNLWQDPAGVSAFTHASISFVTGIVSTLNYSICLVSDGSYNYQGDGISSILVFGMEEKQHSGAALAQTETSPSSYIKTTTTSVTRAADIIALTMPTNMKSAAAYSTFLDIGLPKAAASTLSVFLSLNDATDAQRIYQYQGNATFSYQFQLHIDGASSTTLTASPANLFNQSIGIIMIADPTAPNHYFYQNSTQGSTSSTTTNYFTDPVTNIRFATYDPTASNVGGNISFLQVAVFPKSVSKSVMQTLLFSTPPTNPDAITGPNYMSQTMLSSVVPTVPPFQIFHGPAGLPASDSIPNTSYDYLPTTVAYAGDITTSQNSTFSTGKYAWLQWTNRCTSTAPAVYTGSISGTTLTVTSISAGNVVGTGRIITGSGVSPNTYITAFLSGAGGTGTYTINNSQSVSSPVSISQIACIATKTYNSVPGPGFTTSDGSKVSLDFSTYDRANAETLMGALYVNGYPSHASGACPTGQTYCGYLDPVNAVGIADGNVLTYTAASAGATSIFTSKFTRLGVSYAYTTDTFVLPNGKFGVGTATAWGSIADFEMADSRLASNTLSLVQQLSFIHHNASVPLKYGLLPDPLFSAKLSGLCGIGLPSPTPNCDITNLAQIATAADYINVLVQNPAPAGYTFDSSLSAYYALFGTPTVDFPPSHLGVAMIMGTWPGGTTLANATSVHNFIVSNGLGGTQTGPIQGQCSRFTVQKWLTVLGLSTSC